MSRDDACPLVLTAVFLALSWVLLRALAEEPRPDPGIRWRAPDGVP